MKKFNLVKVGVKAAHKECMKLMVWVMDVTPAEAHNIFNDIDKMSNLRYWKIFL